MSCIQKLKKKILSIFFLPLKKIAKNQNYQLKNIEPKQNSKIVYLRIKLNSKYGCVLHT